MKLYDKMVEVFLRFLYLNIPSSSSSRIQVSVFRPTINYDIIIPVQRQQEFQGYSTMPAISLKESSFLQSFIRRGDGKGKSRKNTKEPLFL